MFATTTRPPFSLASIAFALVRRAAKQGVKAMAAWRAWRRRREDAFALQQMSDRDLLDVGLGRSDLPFVLSDHIDDRRRDGCW